MTNGNAENWSRAEFQGKVMANIEELHRTNKQIREEIRDMKGNCGNTTGIIFKKVDKLENAVSEIKGANKIIASVIGAVSGFVSAFLMRFLGGN